MSDDFIYGGAGNDTISGGAREDTVYGGDDADTFILEDGFGNGEIVYGGEGGVDSDSLDLSALGAGITVTFTGDEQGTITDGTDTGTFFGIENAVLTDQDDVLDAKDDEDLGIQIDAGGGNDSIDGSNFGTDLIYAGTGDDNIRGWLGDDTLYGGAGADTIYGDIGNDTVFGGAGNDTITNFSGDATLYGGDDADRLQVFDSGGGDFDGTIIYGGEGGTDSDTLDLSALGAGITVTFTDAEDGTFTDGHRYGCILRDRERHPDRAG